MSTEDRTMQRSNLWVWEAVLVGLLLALCGSTLPAQTPPTGSVWNYTLLDGSQLDDEWLIPGPPDILAATRGTFQLRLVEQNLLLSTFAVENVSFEAGAATGPKYKVVGQGTYRVGGEVAVVQDMFLELSIDNGVTNQLCYFTNTEGSVTRLWPMLQVSLDQTNGTALRKFHLDINAAPFREVWFSTVTPSQAGLWNEPTNTVSAGDLASSVGRVVKRNHELTRSLGILCVVPDLGLKGLDVLFIVTDVTSPRQAVTLGLPQVTNQPPDSLAIQRTGGDRVFQLERAANPTGPFAPSVQLPPTRCSSIWVL